jgi:hypothetical protein
MVRHRKLAVSALDLNLGGGADDTEYFVIIAFGIGGQKSPTLGLNIQLSKVVGITVEERPFRVAQAFQNQGGLSP